MRPLLLAALVAVAPAAAFAGPALGLRVGYDISSGSASTGTPMSELARSAVPLQLDATWRFGPRFSIGAYYGFGFGQLSKSIADRCSSLATSCSVWTMRTGIRAEYAFPEDFKRLAPWVGLGTGWEWAHGSVSHPSESGSQTVSGWEAVSLEVGADYKVAPKLWLGPYVVMRVGQYGRINGYSIVNKAWHEWYGLGIRGRWDF